MGVVRSSAYSKSVDCPEKRTNKEGLNYVENKRKGMRELRKSQHFLQKCWLSWDAHQVLQPA